MPELVGSEVSDRDYFRALAERIFDDGKMFIGPSTMGPLVRQWHMNLARPLHHRDGSFAGVIVAAPAHQRHRQVLPHGEYRHPRHDRRGGPGCRATCASRSGPNPIDPGTSIADSDMFKAMQADPDSVWVGRTALDGIERVHGFHRVADRDLAVVVAVDRDEAMHATNTLGHHRLSVRRRHHRAAAGARGHRLCTPFAPRTVARRRSATNAPSWRRPTAELELAKALADDKTMQLEATLAGMSDGVAMVDGDLRLVEWNPRFPEIAGVPGGMLRVGLPMEDIMRAQAAAGVFGDVDIEAEVARRIADLRAGNYADTIERTRPDGRVVELRRNRLPDGGFVTLYTDITARRESMSALREANALAEAATKAMSRFVAIVSHEIRTPLNALLNSLSLLADSGMAATQQGLLDMARQSGDALLALINDILEMSRMEVGQLALRPSRVRAAPADRERDRDVRRPGGGAADRAADLDRARRAGRAVRGSRPAAAGADQPAVQRGEVRRRRARCG